MTNITVKLAHLEAASAQDFTAVDLAKKTPYLPGRTVTAHFIAVGNTGTAPAYSVEGSNDNSTWVADVAVSVVQEGHDVVDCKAYRYMRGSITTASGTADGVLSIYLEPKG